MMLFNDIKLNHQSNIDDLLEKAGERYILIKPNEDILAIHNGSKKVDQKYYLNHLFNSGGSYSYTCLVQFMALTKYIKVDINILV